MFTFWDRGSLWQNFKKVWYVHGELKLWDWKRFSFFFLVQKIKIKSLLYPLPDDMTQWWSLKAAVKVLTLDLNYSRSTKGITTQTTTFKVSWTFLSLNRVCRQMYCMSEQVNFKVTNTPTELDHSSHRLLLKNMISFSKNVISKSLEYKEKSSKKTHRRQKKKKYI